MSQRVAFRSTRESRRIDYADPRVMRARAKLKEQQRMAETSPLTAPWVIARFLLEVDPPSIRIHAICRTAVYTIDEDGPLSPNPARWARWRTRQAAHQWLNSHPRDGVRPMNLDSCAVDRR